MISAQHGLARISDFSGEADDMSQLRKMLPLLLGLVFGLVTIVLADSWIMLGQRTVSSNLDHDSINVSSTRGNFRSIKLRVREVPVQFRRAVVHYGDGADDKLEVGDRVPVGGETRAIDLRGSDRVIRSIDLWYDANSFHGKRAVVSVYGRR